MTRSGRWRGRACLGLATAVLVATPAAAATEPFVGPTAYGWVLWSQRKPAASAMVFFLAQPTTPGSIRLIVEFCGDRCTRTDDTLPGSLVATDTSVTIKTRHPRLGSVAMNGVFDRSSFGSQRSCYMSWDGTTSSASVVSGDFHELRWGGRIGNGTVRGLPHNACAGHHTAGVLLLTTR